MSWGSNKKSKLIEFEDIVKELSEKNNISYEEMEEICRLSMEYVKKLTDEPDTLSILIPELGTMYYSERLGEFYKQRVTNRSGRNAEKKIEIYNFLDRRTKLIEKQEKLYKIKKSYHRRKPFLYKFKNIYKKLFNGKIVKLGATLGYRELWTKFSEIQNNIQNGKENKFD